MNNRHRFRYSSLGYAHRRTVENATQKKRERGKDSGLLFLSILFSVLFLASGSILSERLWAQPGSGDSSGLRLSGSVDVYYVHYGDSLPSESYRTIGSISPRSDQFGLNLAQVRLAYDHPSVRGRLALHYGDIPGSSWSADFPILQEGTVGVGLGSGFWVDGGFFPTHIGTESFMPGNNRISSIAAITYLEPFYQSGLRLSYEGSEEFSAQLHLLSGYNTFVDHNGSKSVGTYLSWRTSEEVNLVYAALLGNDAPDSAVKQFRTYHNAQVMLDPTENFRIVLGFDLCTQQNTAAGGGTATMNGGLLLLSYAARPDWRINTRFEFLNDREGLLSGTFPNEAGVVVRTNLAGITLGVEHRPTENSYVRLEGRMLQTPEATTFFGGGIQRRRLDAGITAGVAFDAPIF